MQKKVCVSTDKAALERAFMLSIRLCATGFDPIFNPEIKV